MSLPQEDLWFWGITIVVLILIVYFLPFLLALWIKPTMLLWGFLVGRRRRRAILSARFPPDEPRRDSSSDESRSAAGISSNPGTNVRATDEIKNEQLYLNETHKRRVDYLDDKMNGFDQRLAELTKRDEQRQERDRNNFPGKTYYLTLSYLNKKTAKDFLLLLIIAAVFFVDMLIAQQVFTSLGLFPTDKYSIFGKEVKLTLILGVFLTAVAAIFLHIVWDRTIIEKAKTRTAGFIIGCVTLGILALLRLISVIAPPTATPVVEGALMLGWILGVIVFYWLLGEILGEKPNWFELFIAIALPVLFVSVLFLGILFLLEKLVESLITLSMKSWIHLGHARTTKQRDNVEAGSQATIQGFYRGLTF